MTPSEYEKTLARMHAWTYGAAEWDDWDQIIAEEAEEAAAADRRRSDAIDAQRREYQRELAAEVADMADRRGHPGRPTTHDVALATSAVSYRLGLVVDRAAIQAVLETDPEPVGEAGSIAGARLDLPADDHAFTARLAALAVEAEDLAETRFHARRPPGLSTTTEWRLRSIRDAFDELLELGA